MYKIEIERTYKGKTEVWAVWRRYNQFLKLDEKLKKKVWMEHGREREMQERHKERERERETET